MYKPYWRVLALFNVEEDGEETKEVTILQERFFDAYWEMRNWVTDSEANGAIGGMVFKKNSNSSQWVYYMDVV